MHPKLSLAPNWLFSLILLSACSTSSKTTTAAACPDTSAAGSLPVNSNSQLDAQPQVCPGITVAACPTCVPSFSTAIVPIVHARCDGCHSQNNDAGLWPLSDQQSLSDWQISILKVLRDCTQPPPSSGVSLAMSERKALETWLVCGAPDN
jgi:hypothetical protein